MSERSTALRPDDALQRLMRTRAARSLPAVRCGVLRLAALAALQACTTWQPFASRPIDPDLSALPYAVRVTRVDGSRLSVLSPFIRRDTLVGRVGDDTATVPLREILQLEREHFSAIRTTGVVVAIPAALFVAYLIHCRDGRCEAQPAY